MNAISKTCTKCGNEWSLSEFSNATLEELVKFSNFWLNQTVWTK